MTPILNVLLRIFTFLGFFLMSITQVYTQIEHLSPPDIKKVQKKKPKEFKIPAYQPPKRIAFIGKLISYKKLKKKPSILRSNIPSESFLADYEVIKILEGDFQEEALTIRITEDGIFPSIFDFKYALIVGFYKEDMKNIWRMSGQFDPLQRLPSGEFMGPVPYRFRQDPRFNQLVVPQRAIFQQPFLLNIANVCIDWRDTSYDSAYYSLVGDTALAHYSLPAEDLYLLRTSHADSFLGSPNPINQKGFIAITNCSPEKDRPKKTDWRYFLDNEEISFCEFMSLINTFEYSYTIHSKKSIQHNFKAKKHENLVFIEKMNSKDASNKSKGE